MPSRLATPGRYSSTITSARCARRQETSLPAPLFRLIPIDFLLRASALCGELLKLLPAGRVPAAPACSARLPVGGPGSSILITSAPRSARIIVQKGPGASLVRSSTLIPSSGAGIVDPPEELLNQQVPESGAAIDMGSPAADMN